MQTQPHRLATATRNPLRNPHRKALALAAAATLLGSLGAPALAQNQWVVSTSSDVGFLTADLPFLEDGDLFFVAENTPPRACMQKDHWRGVGAMIPDDIDGLGFVKGQTAWHKAVRFSTLSDQNGFLDGDVLGIAPGGGIEVVVAESDLSISLGATAPIDLDALDFDGQGRLLFSLQNDLTSSQLGLIENGDVLRRESNGTIVRLYSEADVQAAFSLATGSTAAVGDVHGLAFSGGNILVVVQSPSAHDGSVLLLGSSPMIVADEALLGIAGEELDALAAAPFDHRSLSSWYEPNGVAGGGRVVFEGEPGEFVAVVPSGQVGFVAAEYFPGFGAFFVDPNDPMLLAQLYGPGLVLTQLDGAGRAEFQIQLPLVGSGLGFDGVTGWTLQLLALSTGELSAPVRIDV